MVEVFSFSKVEVELNLATIMVQVGGNFVVQRFILRAKGVYSF